MRAVAAASVSARAASPRPICVREQTLLGDRGRGSNSLSEDVLVQHRGVERHGRGDVEHRPQRLVLDLDQRQRRLRHVRVDSGNSSHRLADPVHLVARDVELRHHPHVVAHLAHGDGGANRQLQKIHGCDDGKHARERLRARRVHTADAGVRVRATLQLGIHHPRQCEVGRIDRLAGDALARIELGARACPPPRAGAVRDSCSSQRPWAQRPGLATAAMASTILP